MLVIVNNKINQSINQVLCFLNHETNKYSNQQLVKWDETTRTYTIRKLKTLSGRQKRLTNRELICECCRAVCIRIDFNILLFLEQAAPLQWHHSGVGQPCFVWLTEMVGHQIKTLNGGKTALIKLIEVERGESGRSTFESNRLTMCDWIWTRFVYKYRH